MQTVVVVTGALWARAEAAGLLSSSTSSSSPSSSSQQQQQQPPPPQQQQQPVVRVRRLEPQEEVALHAAMMKELTGGRGNGRGLEEAEAAFFARFRPSVEDAPPPPPPRRNKVGGGRDSPASPGGRDSPHPHAERVSVLSSVLRSSPRAGQAAAASRRRVRLWILASALLVVLAVLLSSEASARYLTAFRQLSGRLSTPSPPSVPLVSPPSRKVLRR